jgi:alkanesulfonate monooxygenase SsuD/methylene tetrahydromethanopterin reductase-like flavin-dependent oxidoreductase (luciferase family)
MTRRLAVSVMPLETRRETLIFIATTAERLGYEAYFLPETWALDTTIVLAEAALRTERITLAPGVLGVWSRSAGTLAMAASTLHALSGGRFILGLGASTPQLTEGLHDIPYKASAAQVRRVVTQVRTLLRGDRIPLTAAPGARPLKLNLPPAPDLPIYLAALGDETIRLTGELADGWLPFLYPHGRLSEGIALLREGAARAGGRDRLPAVCPSVPVAVAENAGKARDRAAWFVSFYLGAMGTLYRGSLVRQGFGSEVEAVLAANPKGPTGAVPPEADELLEQLTVFGTPGEARARLARWYEAGAALPILLLSPHLDREEIEFTLTALCP